MYEKDGDGADALVTEKVNIMKTDFDNNRYLRNNACGAGSVFGPIVYQLQLLQDELDALRTEIGANKEKTGNVVQTTITGNAGTATKIASITNDNIVQLANDQTITGTKTFSSAIAGSITGNSATTSETTITNGQASAITANSLKVSFSGATNTTLAFGDMITTPPAKGSKAGTPSTYSIILTATTGTGKTAVVKTTTLVLQ